MSRRNMQDQSAEAAPATATVAETIPATPAPASKPMPTLDEALATAKTEQPDHFAHVLRVVALTAKGRPARVVIACSDPQTKQGDDGKPVSVCQLEREIATQDLFQVRRCVACAERVVRRARRERAKARAKQDRALARQVREGTIPATEAGQE